MFWLIVLGFWLMTSKEAWADINICKFSSWSSNDWVELCNNDGGEVNLSNYSLVDSSGSTINAVLNSGCKLANGSSYTFTVSNRLNNSGDYIALVNSGITVDCVSYGDGICPGNDVHAKISGETCQEMVDGVWQTSANCNNSGTVNCIEPTSIPVTPSVVESPSPTPRTLTAKIISLPADSSLGNTFEVKFRINGGNGNYEYYVKGYGGVNDDNSVEIDTTSGWLNYDGSWEKMPKFKTNDAGILEAVVRLRAKQNKENGLYRIRIKIKESNGPKESESELKTIQIEKLPPATATKAASATPKVSETIYPLPTEAFSTSIMPTGEVEGDSVGEGEGVSVTPTPNSNKMDFSEMLPIAFIGGGGLMLIVPLIISKIKK